MPSIRQVHVYPHEVNQVSTVRKTTCTRFLSSTGFLVLVIIGILSVVTVSIVVPVVLVVRSNNKLESNSGYEDVTTPISSFTDSTSITAKTRVTTSTTTSTTISSTTVAISYLPTSASPWIDSTVEGSVIDDLNNTLSSMATTNETATETIMETTPKTSTRRPVTTPLIPPNLLINSGAEEGTIFGWNQTSPSLVIIDTNGQFNNNYYPRTGKYCFAGGDEKNDFPSGLVQNVKLLGGIQGFTEIQLDSPMRRVELEFYYQTWDHLLMRHDQVEVSLLFRSSTSARLHTETSGGLACKQHNPGWCRYFKAFPLRVGTRSIDYTMTFIRKDLGGTAIDSYIDDNSLKSI